MPFHFLPTHAIAVILITRSSLCTIHTQVLKKLDGGVALEKANLYTLCSFRFSIVVSAGNQNETDSNRARLVKGQNSGHLVVLGSAHFCNCVT